MKRAVALTLTEHGARCIAVIVIRTGNLFCRIFPWLRCRRGCGKRLQSSECPVFSPGFLRAEFQSWRAGRSRKRGNASVAKKILLIAGICLAFAVGAVVCLFVAFFVSMERGEKHRRQWDAEYRSGKWDFGDQPALFAVAQGIVKNNPDAIRAAAKRVPDLQGA